MLLHLLSLTLGISVLAARHSLPMLPGPKTASLEEMPAQSHATGNLVFGWVPACCAGSIGATLAAAVSASDQNGHSIVKMSRHQLFTPSLLCGVSSV